MSYDLVAHRRSLRAKVGGGEERWLRKAGSRSKSCRGGGKPCLRRDPEDSARRHANDSRPPTCLPANNRISFRVSSSDGKWCGLSLIAIRNPGALTDRRPLRPSGRRDAYR
jgi:hypothetical protein